MPAGSSKRVLCQGCGRPQRVCLCQALVAVHADIELIIWQDPTEAKHKLSTAPLLHKSLPNSQLLVGERFSYEQIFAATEPAHCALLYPLEAGQPVSVASRHKVTKLLLLDGTWKKVRRLLHLNPWLRELPFVRLAPQSVSRYAIRKSPREDGLSTIEAGVAALSWLDTGQDYSVILGVLERLVELQQQHTPENRRYRRS